MVLTIDAINVGEVYLKLAKYMFSVKPTLWLQENTASKRLSHISIFS